MSLTIRALCVGRAYGLPKPSFTYMCNWGAKQDLPLIMFVIEGGEFPVVVDTGADPSRAEEYHGLVLEQTPDERPDTSLRNIGIDPDDVRLVVNTHLHWDHSSNNHLFPNAEVVVQQRELDFAKNPVTWHRRQFEALPGLEAAWRRAEHQISPVHGDVTLAPGVSTVSLPGHTPGSQGVLVEAGSQSYLIGGDTVYLYENWDGDAEGQPIPVGLYTDLVAYETSIKKIQGLPCEVIPSHDFRVLERGRFS
ncbi:N-acyl homoserine lactonase family protein [Parafrankia elaeagni]|uniref:N-acyl homoserine lactonase family protein n=1 Tax=Parafrankia elaeagni TaxID=222534 RepID=UPI00035E0BC3|nr:N-acyl homoserine lactonase family protein [Parafrankia elaeagni]